MAEAQSKPIVLSHEASRQIIPICLRAIRRRKQREEQEQLVKIKTPQPPDGVA